MILLGYVAWMLIAFFVLAILSAGIGLFISLLYYMFTYIALPIMGIGLIMYIYKSVSDNKK